MNKAILFIFLFLSHYAGAQKNIDGLIRAEKDFAAYSAASNTKEAFLKFLDSTGIVFEKGQPVNGIASWNKKEKRPGILNWHPRFAEIAASGDFGYTTGPWTFQPRTLSDSIVARGQYSTVWHTDKNGDWKFLLDLGVGNLPATDSSEVETITVDKFTTSPVDLLSLVKAEEKFIRAFKKDKAKAYSQFLALHSILNRNSHLPATRPDEQSVLIQATPSNTGFTIKGSGIAKSGDLGFVYGNAVLNDETENYLRIWRREKEGWKIALEVLRF
jgi:ketosteroid isomerase-like protein